MKNNKLTFLAIQWVVEHVLGRYIQTHFLIGRSETTLQLLQLIWKNLFKWKTAYIGILHGEKCGGKLFKEKLTIGALG